MSSPTKARLAAEIEALRKRVADLERSKAELTRAAEAAERRAAEARSVLEVGRAIPESLNLPAVLDLIVERAGVLLGAQGTGLAVVESAGRDAVLRFVALHGMSSDFPERMRPRHWRDGTTPMAIAQRRPVWSADILRDPAFELSPGTRAAIEAEGYRAVLSVPLLAADRVLGALAVYRDAAGAFSADEVDFLQSFGAQAAIAIENTRSYEEAERGRREAEVVAALARDINASLDLATVFERVAESARELCGSDLAHIALRDAGSEAVVFRYWAGTPLEGQQPYAVQPGQGVGGRVLLTGRPFRVDHSAQDSQLSQDYVATVHEEGIVAALAVPIKIDSHVEGLLFAGNRHARRFTDRDEAVLLQLAAHAAIAIRNARLLAESEARRRAAESLAELGRLVSQSLNLEEVGQRIADSVRVLLGAETSTIYRLQGSSGDLVALALSGDMGPGLGRNPVLPRGIGVSGLAVRERRPVVSANALTDPRIALTPEFRDRADRAPFHAALALPLLVQERVIGALAVADRPGRMFNEEEIRLVQAFADQAALALDNARLYEEAQRRLAELTTVQRIARAINSTLRLEEVFQAVVEQISEAFGYRMVSLYLREGDALALQAHIGYDEVIPRIPLGQGMKGRVARSGRAEFLRDEAPGVESFEVLGVRQAITVPLRTGDGQVIGTLAVESKGEPTLTEGDWALLTLLADQVSVAVTNARLYGETTRRHQEAEELARMARTLTETLDTSAVGERIVESVGLLFGALSSGLRLLQPDGSLVAIVWGDPAHAHAGPGHILAPGAGISGRVIAQGGPVWSADVLSEPGIVLTDETRNWFTSSGHRAILAVPLRVKGKIIGVLSIADRAGRTFSEREVALLQTLADQAATALENSRLYGDLQAALKAVADSQHQVIQGERLRALGELAGGVAHDFNNILAVILGRAQILLHQARDPDTRRQAEVIEQMAMEGARTVRRIQDFARMRRARPFQTVNLNQVIDEVVKATRSRWRDQAQAEGVTYDVRVEAVPVPPVAGDPSELREAFTNLVLNALDAMPGGGCLTLRTAIDGEQVHCTVTDTGVGMTEDVRHRIFDPFFTTKGDRGIGLGLSLVYGIVRRHGGDIDVRSQPGQGSAFILRFPGGREIPQTVAKELPPHPRPGARILVIEDETAVREMLRDLLSAQGHTVVACADGRLGLAQLENERFELVFTDLGMPNLSGWEVARLVKLRQPQTPVALITGSGDRIDPLEARAHGVDFLLPKPCQVDDVHAVVAQALAQMGAPPRSADPPG